MTDPSARSWVNLVMRSKVQAGCRVATIARIPGMYALQ